MTTIFVLLYLLMGSGTLCLVEFTSGNKEIPIMEQVTAVVIWPVVLGYLGAAYIFTRIGEFLN